MWYLQALLLSNPLVFLFCGLCDLCAGPTKHLRLWIFPQVVRLLVVQATLCVGEGELQAGVCGRSHGCVTSKSLQGCLLEDLGALGRGFAHVSGEILKCHGNNY